MSSNMILTNEEIIFFESHPEITISELLKYPIEMYKKMEEGNLLKTDEEMRCWERCH